MSIARIMKLNILLSSIIHRKTENNWKKAKGSMSWSLKIELKGLMGISSILFSKNSFSSRAVNALATMLEMG